MTLHVVYSTSSGVHLPSVTQDVSANVQMPSVTLTMNAEEGSVGGGSLILDDPNSALTIRGLRDVFFWESAESPGNQMIAVQFVAPRRYGRGPNVGMDNEMVTDSDRRISIDLQDANALLARRLITGSDGNRPAENDTDRINWLLGSPYLDGVGNTASFVSGAQAVAMDANDCRGQSAYDVISDCANRSGKNFHVYYNPVVDTSPPTYVGRFTLWYDFAISSNYASTLRLTNVLADIDNSTTYAVYPDMELTVDPSRVISGVLQTYVGGSTYQQLNATSNTFIPVDLAAPNANVKTLAKANQLAQRLLADNNTEDYRITCKLLVPKEHVNIAREGQLVQIKFSHLKDDNFDFATAYTTARVLNRSVTFINGQNYEIGLTLSPTATATDTSVHTFNISTTGDTPGVSSEHFAMPAGNWYARAIFSTGQPGDSAPSAYLNNSAVAALNPGVGSSVAMKIAYNLSPYNSTGLLPNPGGFSYDFTFSTPPPGYGPYDNFTSGDTQYFHASWASDGHTANAQSMQLLLSQSPL